MARYAILGLLLLLPLAAGPSCSTTGDMNAAGAPAAAGTAAEAGPVSNEALNDPQILQVLLSASSGEISLGSLALTHASSAMVHDFAQMTVSDFGAAKEQEQSFAAAHDLTPRPSGTSESLNANAVAIQGELDTVSGVDFDRMYMSSQLDMHRGLLTLIDEQLLPIVTNPELRALLEATRTTIATHFDQARAMVASM
jgi:putative membrane protein